MKRRSLERIQRQGHWHSLKSVRRYEQGTVSLLLLNQMPPCLKDHLMLVDHRLEDVMCCRVRPPQRSVRRGSRSPRTVTGTRYGRRFGRRAPAHRPARPPWLGGSDKETYKTGRAHSGLGGKGSCVSAADGGMLYDQMVVCYRHEAGGGRSAEREPPWDPHHAHALLPSTPLPTMMRLPPI